MLFSSIVFLFRFLPAALLLYFISPKKLKNLTLLVCSLVFYSWGEVKYLWIMAAVILINYICGLLIGRSGGKARKLYLAVAIAGSLSMLLYFKYAGFFAENANRLFGTGISVAAAATLPLGISFYTFQSMSYSIDVYRRTVQHESNIVNFGAYVAMFPQLIAGPIVRYTDVSARLRRPEGRVTLQRFDEGASLFVFGLAKKVLLADGVNMLWTDIVGAYSGGKLVTEGVGIANASAPLAWLGVVAYALYIYNDFSGYSLMAIGLGKILGFDFPSNFDQPYMSRSITEFWRRWHITLSSWFREYVYQPLGGNRKGLPRQIVNLAIVWLLTGFWHGAGWNFLIWGLYYFLFLSAEKLFLSKALDKGRVWPRIYTLAVVCVGWAIFAAGDPGVGLGALFRALFAPGGGTGALYFARNYAGILAVAAFFSCGVPAMLYDKVKHRAWVRAGMTAALLIICVSYMVAGGYKPFLYFNF
ncbi:MAG: MBOAT family protein [Oscillospiraceae bacterium]|nr:MBOAT family protein [Oscillospiraceae bacterium]